MDKSNSSDIEKKRFFFPKVYCSQKKQSVFKFIFLTDLQFSFMIFYLLKIVDSTIFANFTKISKHDNAWYYFYMKKSFSINQLSNFYGISSQNILPISKNEFSIYLNRNKAILLSSNSSLFIIKKISSKDKINLNNFSNKYLILSTKDCNLPCKIISSFNLFSIVDNCTENLSKIKCIRKIQNYNNPIFHSYFQKYFTHHDIFKTNEILTFPESTIKATGLGQCITIVDSGVDIKSPWFSNNNFKTKKITNYIPYGDNFDDEEGHGTFMAGIAAGRSNCEYSSNKYNGVASDSHLLVIDIKTNKSSDFSWPVNFSDIFDVPSILGCKVHLNAWSSNTPLLTMAIDYLAYTHPDLTIIFPYYLNNENKIQSPGDSKNVLTVGAVYGPKSSLLVDELPEDVIVLITVVYNNEYYRFHVSGDPMGSSIIWVNSTLKLPFHSNTKILNKKVSFQLNINESISLSSIILFVFHQDPLDKKYNFPIFRLNESLYNIFKDSSQISITLDPFEDDIDNQLFNNWNEYDNFSDNYFKIKPEIIIPGGPMLGPKSGSNKCDRNGLTIKGGPSVSAAIAAGNAALIKEYFEINDIENPFKIGGALMKAFFVNSATDSITHSESLFSNHRGFGIPNLGELFVSQKGFKKNFFYNLYFEQDILIKKNMVHNYTFFSTSSDPIIITLSWLDYPRDPNSILRLSTPLIIIIKKNREILLPNHNLEDSLHYDKINNIQNIKINPKNNENIQLLIYSYQFDLIEEVNYSLVIRGKIGKIHKNFTETNEKSCPIGCEGVGSHSACIQQNCICGTERSGDFCQFRSERVSLNKVVQANQIKRFEWVVYKVIVDKWTRNSTFYINIENINIKEFDILVDVGKSPSFDNYYCQYGLCDKIKYKKNQLYLLGEDWSTVAKWNPFVIAFISKSNKLTNIKTIFSIQR